MTRSWWIYDLDQWQGHSEIKDLDQWQYLSEVKDFIQRQSLSEVNDFDQWHSLLKLMILSRESQPLAFLSEWPISYLSV